MHIWRYAPDRQMYYCACGVQVPLEVTEGLPPALWRGCRRVADLLDRLAETPCALTAGEPSEPR